MVEVANKVITQQNEAGMLRRALERIIQLYTDRSHFIFELLQNAEDAEAKNIKFIQYSDRLEVFHDGNPFTSNNLQSLCDIGKSDKVDNLNQIGEFGVGFKSVFGICDTVRLYSAPAHVRKSVDSDAVPFALEIKDFTHPVDIREEQIPPEYTTRFVFPYTVGQTFSGFTSTKTLIDTISKKLQNLGITTLLFMKNLESIEYQISTGEECLNGLYLLDKKEINDHCQLVSAFGVTDKEEKYIRESDEKISYLKFSRHIEKFAPRSVDIAFPIRIEEDGRYTCISKSTPYVSVYFPTETESKLDFIVQGPYRTTPNRSSIPADDPDNIYLAKETAKLLSESILELRQNKKLNMSFLKILPISEKRFESFGLFKPLYETIKNMFCLHDIIPTKSGRYVRAKEAKISRKERLTSVFNDEQLSKLINDGVSYSWLPTCLTETNREYKPVLEYMTGELGIKVIHPGDLRYYFAANSEFLPKQSDDWLAELYGIFEDIPGEFSRARNEANMATANVVKTSAGTFVAPYRREGSTFVPNVFLPSQRRIGINFVDQKIYDRCRHFFDDILNLQKLTDYEILIKDIEKRYNNNQNFSYDQHIGDIRTLLNYIDRNDYRDDVKRIIRDVLLLRCSDGVMRSSRTSKVFLPKTPDDIDIKAYYFDIKDDVFFVDDKFYAGYGIRLQDLIILGARSSLLVDEDLTSGRLPSGTKGRTPEWSTIGDFRWKLSADSIIHVLKYISNHPKSPNSKLKSRAIIKTLLANEHRLCGHVSISGNIVPDKNDEPCSLIHILRGDYSSGGIIKWLYNESFDLVSSKDVSKNEISIDLYGKIKSDSIIFKLLGFKKSATEEIDELKKIVPVKTLQKFFEEELNERYGLSISDLARFGVVKGQKETSDAESLPFPRYDVRSWHSLKKHVAEMLYYANPKKYEDRVRRVRVSDIRKDARSYLKSIYRYEGSDRSSGACQLCHNKCTVFEATEIFQDKNIELEPLNLCLCPNCAAVYRKKRSNASFMAKIEKKIMEMNDSDIEKKEHIAIPLDKGEELWFTQTHFAEVCELLKLIKTTN